MKIYRISNIRRPGREHDGYEYLSNKSKAIKKQKSNEKCYWERQNDDDYEDIEDSNLPYEIDIVETLEIMPTKSGIIEFLNNYCDYANNG